MIEFETFPKSGQALQVVLSIVDVFRLHHQTIDSHASDGMKSDDVLSVVRNDLEAIGFEVEKNKSLVEANSELSKLPNENEFPVKELNLIMAFRE